MDVGGRKIENGKNRKRLQCDSIANIRRIDVFRVLFCESCVHHVHLASTLGGRAKSAPIAVT